MEGRAAAAALPATTEDFLDNGTNRETTSSARHARLVGPELLQDEYILSVSRMGDVKRGSKRPRNDGRHHDTTLKEQQDMPRQVSRGAARTPCKNHPFEVDAKDHCETPIEAYRDVIALLDRIAKSIGKARHSLSIYDPYYCDGGVKVKLKSLGFSNVRNDNEDFYRLVEKKIVPQFDVLLSNPPYSGTHVERLLTFAAKCRKPFLLLLPHYVYTKDYYQCALGSKVKPFYLVPTMRYSYLLPPWVKNGSTALKKGKLQTAPFPSFWYCHTAAARSVSPEWLTQTYGTSGVYRQQHDRQIQYANCTAHIPRDMKGEFDTSKKRPNPKARKRAAAKKRKRAAMMVGM